MRAFTYERLDAATGASRRADHPGTTYIAGGTDLLQLMQEGIAHPRALLDVSRVGTTGVTAQLDGIRIGAATRLADVIEDPIVAERLPLVAEALAASASPQVRNMATIGGNLLQKTRCLYFRDVTTPCNKREPGSGCPAQAGQNRLNAVFGGSPHCIATHASDLAVALVALDAEVIVERAGGEKSIRLDDFYRLPGDTPYVETALEPGDLITAVFVPIQATNLPGRYLKVRDRASFEWALVSAAVALVVADGEVVAARVAAGGVGTKPWRLPAVEDRLVGRPMDVQTLQLAAEAAADGADPRPGNAFKVPLLVNAVARALAATADQEANR
ncbi:FAD binding domain-containing protein [Chthonobacter rhizosphaerae]|uniref:FAD binding domain-containing protein n=1 Tax=Chthonobacter rhizosphaerae TaxID=2735553 RepID=UPI0015EFD708|nr:xanthine dehydrogenase family protein subunit M [Chthonobacter rhizosphaerae]